MSLFAPRKATVKTAHRGGSAVLGTQDMALIHQSCCRGAAVISCGGWGKALCSVFRRSVASISLALIRQLDNGLDCCWARRTRLEMLSVPVSPIPGEPVLHAPSQVRLGSLNQRANIIGHPTVSEHDATTAGRIVTSVAHWLPSGAGCFSSHLFFGLRGRDAN